MNIFEYDDILYKGKVNRDFYIFCFKKNTILIKYLFINLWNIILSILFKSRKGTYRKKNICILEI